MKSIENVVEEGTIPKHRNPFNQLNITKLVSPRPGEPNMSQNFRLFRRWDLSVLNSVFIC